VNKKTKQLNNLISLHDDEYKTMSMELNDLKLQYEESVQLIEKIKLDIKKYNDDIIASMMNDAESYVRNYKTIKDYIGHLNNEVSSEKEKNKSILHNLTNLEDHCISLKVKIKGYELLIEQHESEIRANDIKTQNKEIDDMWLLKRTIHD
jgi:predicted  nucleic acid-binding Zn-ribbon protein